MNFEHENNKLYLREKFNVYYQKKIEKIFTIIPKDVKSIVDVGCGNGVITNELGKYFDVTGVDINEKKLQFVKTKKLKSSSGNIDLPDYSFDLVFTSETLEHLNNNIFNKTISELKRLSKNYIFITVPHNENLKKLLIKCPYCGNIFNKSYHLRTFRISLINKLFPEFDIISSFNYGAKVRNYIKLLSDIKHRFSPARSWIPRHWTQAERSRESFCPQCNEAFKIEYKFHIVSFLCDSLNTLLTSKEPYQLFILLKKRKNA